MSKPFYTTATQYTVYVNERAVIVIDCTAGLVNIVDDTSLDIAHAAGMFEEIAECLRGIMRGDENDE